MSAGRNFYGPGGPYENFAGRDATRGLACQSFDEEMLTKDLDGPLDDCGDLEKEQLENLQGWVERFDEKVCVLMRWEVIERGIADVCIVFGCGSVEAVWGCEERAVVRRSGRSGRRERWRQ